MPMGEIVIGTYEGSLAGWRLSAERGRIGVAFAFVPHSAPVRSIALDAIAGHGTSLVSTSSDETARVFDLERLQSVGQLVAHGGEACVHPSARPGLAGLAGQAAGAFLLGQSQAAMLLRRCVWGAPSLALVPAAAAQSLACCPSLAPFAAPQRSRRAGQLLRANSGGGRQDPSSACADG